MNRSISKAKKIISKNPYLTAIVVFIFLTALFFRVYNYYERIYFYADNALFVLASYYAFKNFTLPQIGPFAQAPFFTGPWWLWILQIFFIFPFGILTPWYIMTIASFGFIFLIYIVGKEIGGKPLAILASFLAAISTAQIDNSFYTWNAAADAYFGLFSVYFLLQYNKQKRPLHLFLLGFTVSLAATIHFQTFLLAPVILVALFLAKPKVKNFLALVLGILIPLLPFLYFDIRFNWFETRRILDYALIGQSRIYVPNRWLTYAGVFWPETWAWIIGGKTWVSYLTIGLLSLLTFFKLKNYKKHWNYFLVAIPFVIAFVLFRYYKGERFFYYTNFAQAFVLLLTSWTIMEIYKFKKILGLLLGSIIVVFTLQASVKNFSPRTITYRQVNIFVAEIYQKYPYMQFDIYECPFSGSMISTPVSYKMYYDGRNSLGGLKIGVCNHEMNLSWREVTSDEINKKYSYQRKSTPNIYTEMTEWWKTNPPGKNLY